LGFTENVMKLKEDIKPVSYMKTRAAELRDTTLLLQLASQGEEDFEHGRFLPQDEALARMRSRLRER
jgi:predicted transcriptional regulator